ncbi:MAG: toll/interleukin-1 receptor domain-containing protein [Armatimonadetes bacterium]|nr:toll/interleukin-1 receptor domain-containing protein [Armatimonadota bacterium]
MTDITRNEEIVRFFFGDGFFAGLPPEMNHEDYIHRIAKNLRQAHRIPRKGELTERAKRLRWIEIGRRFLWGHDVFISYPHGDPLSDRFARHLASKLLEDVDVRIDLHETDSEKTIPTTIISDLRRSRILAVIGTPKAYKSTGVSQEIDLFGPKERHVVLIRLKGDMKKAIWWNKVAGPPVTVDKWPFDPATSPAYEQILTSCTIWRARRRRSAVALALVVSIILTASVFSTVAYFARVAAAEANNSANEAKNREKVANQQASDSNNAANAANLEKAAALDARNEANNNTAAAEQREKVANNRAANANNRADVATRAANVAEKRKELADIEAARQGRISAANGTIAGVLDQPNVDLAVDLAMVGTAFNSLRSDRSPTNTSASWISQNLSRVPHQVWVDNLKTDILGGYVNPTSHRLSLVTSSRLVVFDLNSDESTRRTEFQVERPISIETRPSPFRFTVLSAPNGNTVFWCQDKGVFALSNQKAVRLLTKDSPPNIAQAAPSYQDGTIACFHRHLSKEIIDIVDPNRPDDPIFTCDRLLGIRSIVALPRGGYAWVNSTTMWIATRDRNGYQPNSYDLPEAIRGGTIDYFGPTPSNDGFLLVATKAARTWATSVDEGGRIDPALVSVTIASGDTKTTKLPTDDMNYFARMSVQDFELREHRASPFFLTMDNGPKLVEVQPRADLLTFDKVICKFFMPDSIRGAGYFWLTAKDKEDLQFDPARPFRIAAWGEHGEVQVYDYDARPLLFEVTQEREPRFYTISSGGTRLALDEPNSHRVTVCDLIRRPTRFRMAESPPIEGVKQYTITDRYFIRSDQGSPSISVFDLQDLFNRKCHKIEIPIVTPDPTSKIRPAKPDKNRFQVLKIQVGSDDNLYCLLQDNLWHRKALMVTRNWQRSEGVSQVMFMGTGQWLPDSLFEVQGSMAAYSQTSDTLCLWTGIKSIPLDLHGEKPLCVRFDHKRQLWAVGTPWHVLFFDLTGRPLPTLAITLPMRTPKISSEAPGIDFDRQNGNVMAVIGRDQVVRFYDTRTNQLVSTFSVDQAESVKFLGMHDEFIFCADGHNQKAYVYVWKPEILADLLRQRVASYGYSLPNAPH